MQARALARRLNSPATLPGRLLRELRWLWRDLKDVHAELTRLTDERVSKPTPIPPYSAPPETSDPRDTAHDGF